MNARRSGENSLGSHNGRLNIISLLVGGHSASDVWGQGLCVRAIGLGLSVS